MPLSNIHLFRGENGLALGKTVKIWREKFIEKHGEMNLLVIDRENFSGELIADCMAGGFMGSTRMIIFRELLIKTEREIKKDEEKAGEPIDITDEKKAGKNQIEDSAWIRMLEKIPETNFVLFIGNKKPVSDLEKWLEKNATLHDFPTPSISEVSAFVMSELGLNRSDALGFCARLGFYEESQYGKMYTIGKPDFVYLEVEKLKLMGPKQWTREELRDIIPDYREESSFNILGHVWNREPNTLAEIWKKLMDTADHELSMATIITMIRKILVCATYPNIGTIPVTSGQRNTGKKMMHEQQKIKKLYDRIVEVDIAEKSGELPNKADAFLMALLSY